MGAGSGFRVAAEVTELLSPSDLDTLGQSAATGYRCVACGQAGELGAEAASVVVLVTEASGAGPDGPGVAFIRLAHERCSRSRVIISAGSISMLDETPMTVTAAMIPHASGRRALLIAEPAVRMSASTSAGERVDPVLAGLLGQGLHLLASAWERAPDSPGWLVSLQSRARAVISEPSGAMFYIGELPRPLAWRQLVRRRGKVELLTGVLGFGAAPPDDPGEGLRLLADAARHGRLVGGTVRVG